MAQIPGAVYEPRQCPWCSVAVTDPTQQVCKNCAGPLAPPVVRYAPQAATPAPRDPGPPPPPPPRALPSQYRNRVLYWGNVHTIIGIVFTIVFSWTIVFALLGIIFWVYGLRRAHRELRALERGQAVLGTIIGATQDMTQRMGGRHPWVVHYAFTTPGGPRNGSDQGWEPSNALRRPGDPAWIVYCDDGHECSAIWPPVR